MLTRDQQLISSFEHNSHVVLQQYDDCKFLGTFSDDVLLKLASALSRNLQLVSLSCRDDTHYGVGGIGTLLLLGAVAKPSSLTSLDWYGNCSGKDGMKILLRLSTQFCALQSLDLGANRLHEWQGGDGEQIAQVLTNLSSLTRLGLAKNDLCVEGTQLVLDALQRHPKLTELDISENCLVCDYGDASQSVASFLMSDCGRRLRRFRISNNKFGESGLKLMAKALQKNTSLTWLDISHTERVFETVSEFDEFEVFVEEMHENYALLHIEPDYPVHIRQYCERNQQMRNCVVRNIVTFLSLRKFHRQSTLSTIAKEIVKQIAMLVWESRFDSAVWSPSSPPVF